MASTLFAVLMCTPLVILAVNLGRGATGSAQRARAAEAPAASRRPRDGMDWPVRPRADHGPDGSGAAPAAPPRVIATRPRPRRPQDEPSLLAAAAAPVPLVAAPQPPVDAPEPARVAATAEVPVTASTHGWVPAPASAFEAAPALTPRKGAEIIEFPDRFSVRELAGAR